MDHMMKYMHIARQEPPKRPAAERIKDFREIYANFEARIAREQASRCEHCGTPWCEWSCPLYNRISDWLNLAAREKFLEAAEASELTNNFPEICGRICPQDRLCERGCVLEDPGWQAVTIGDIEKFINEVAFEQGRLDLVQRATPNGLRVAIVGSGPAGLACAEELAKVGYAVTVFERAIKPGGLLTFGIPDFKLDKGVVARRIELLRRRGVEFECGVDIGGDVRFDELMAEDYHAAFLGTGAYAGRDADLPGRELGGIAQGLPFLIQVNLAHMGRADLTDPRLDVREREVVVLGGGDTAMDCVRTSARLGAKKVTCLYRRDEANMPGSRREVRAAKEEGVHFLFCAQAVGFHGDDAGRVRAVEYLRTELGERDRSGRREPHLVPGTNATYPADVVLVAYGFEPSPPAFARDLGIQLSDSGRFVVDGNQMTSRPGIFAGGDNVRGADLVVTAIADGRAAARGLDRYLLGLAAPQVPPLQIASRLP